ncbi:MAG: beta-lactamase family protein [Bacteroidaceae bacterium]|nr:beta-lactamase family protein [Bacteroidaceae bacterium]
MKKALSIALFLSVLLTAGCKGTNEQTSLPRGEVSPEWAAAAESFYADAISVTAPDKAQPYSIMAVEHGKVVFEQCYNGTVPESRYDVYSVSKTVLAMAVGFAMEEGLFSIDDRVTDFFPEQLPEHISDTLSAMTIRHLLTMTCGLEETPKLLSVFKKDADADFDWISEFFASNQARMPGTQFYYNFFSPYIIAAILEKTSGTSVMDYITPRLLEPLHITDMEWQDSPAGICIGGWGMTLCTEDIAKLGQFLLQHGKWNGCQLLTSEWVDTMTSKLVESGPFLAFSESFDPAELNDPENDHSQGYGYYVWQGKHGTFRLEGLNGQFAFVSPEKDIVLVFISDSNMSQKYIDLIWKHFAHLF